MEMVVSVFVIEPCAGRVGISSRARNETCKKCIIKSPVIV